ncbi:flagellar motor switch protein FliN [Geochorda subterranea]|uniref:Flagellar motor switch protein FliN n=1 Tax=Geochorda subterranea TaxID=3109564 RepID=A0ABZ1BMF4_9FIRM|nr:flagellar motor switch protein FliN [Limnochorda sp. LNt]WRP13327.1 flagellar motor switch protein FliN [Limnochorda sp. LNt]
MTGRRAPGGRAPQPPPSAPDVTEVHPVRFGELKPEPAGDASGNLELLLDVSVTLSVEIGRARLTLGEVMALRRGSVIELDKLAGEPADIIVNGKLVARGEVVLLDEKFGVKVNDIVTRARLARDLP